MLKNIFIIVIFFSLFLYSQTNTLDALSKAYDYDINSSFAYAKFSAASKNKALINLFQAISDSKSWHANTLYSIAVEERITDTILKANVLNPAVGNDIDNLKSALSMTSYEYGEMYPKLLKTADKDNQKEVVNVINYIIKAEKSNNALLTKALNNLENNKPIDDKYYLCETCGYVEANESPDKCPISGRNKQLIIEYK